MSTSSPLVPPESSTFVTPSSTLTSTTSSETPTGSSSGSNGPAGSELYLFTFLTTLLLLLGVSIAIIIRSLVLRRRFRRRVQEAIANGVLIPGLTTDPMPRNIGEKPKMWDVWIGSPENGIRNAAASEDEDSDMPVEEGLSSTLPVAVIRLSESGSTNSTSTTNRRQTGLMPSHEAIYGPERPPPLFHRFFPRRPRMPSPAPTPANLEAQTGQQVVIPPVSANAGSSSSSSSRSPSSSTPPQTNVPSDIPPNTVQVSLLIAMPSASQSRYEAYVAQSNPHKGAISLPLPDLHPLATNEEGQSPASNVVDLKDLKTTTVTLMDNNPNPDMDGESTRTKDQTEGEAKSPPNITTYPHRLSTSSMLKGKMPESPVHGSHPHPHPHGSAGAWNHLEEGSIPYMEFGVLEVVLDAKDEVAGAGVKTGGTGVIAGGKGNGSGGGNASG